MSGFPSTLVDISGFSMVHKVALLQRMVKHKNYSQPDVASDLEAIRYIENGDIDYFRGVAVKSNFNGCRVDGRLYERDVCPGRLAFLVNEVRAEYSIPI